MNYAQILDDTIVNIIIADNETDAISVSNGLSVLDVTDTDISIGWKKWDTEWRPAQPDYDCIWYPDYKAWLRSEEINAIQTGDYRNLTCQGCGD